MSVDPTGLLAILFPVMLVTVVLLFVLISRWISYKEKLAMLERGVKPSEFNIQHRHEPRHSLRGALTTTFIGLALTIGLLTLGFGPWLLGGLIPMFIGVAQLIAYLLQPDPKRNGNGVQERDADEQAE